MIRNPERIERILDQLRRTQLDAFVCTFAAHVVMLSGYWPVVGTSFALTTRDGTVALLVPADEEQLVFNGWADVVETYAPGRLDSIETPAQLAAGALGRLVARLGLRRARLGYEHGPVSEPASYASMYLFGASILDILAHAAPDASLVSADDALEQLDSVKTPVEIARIRAACDIAAGAFERGRQKIAIGRTEPEIAAGFRNEVSAVDLTRGLRRADGFVFCMSGQNSARAFGAFAQTGHRRIVRGDLVLVHCNSYADGYWTDITRTYEIGEKQSQYREWRTAIREARAAALAAIRPGVHAAAVDRAAREIMATHGFEKLFRHSAGHGVGFAAISANARPRLHPQSPDTLEEGMVFNVEPAIYWEGVGGMRHCDMVAVTPSGVEVLTAFQSDEEDLWMPGSARAA